MRPRLPLRPRSHRTITVDQPVEKRELVRAPARTLSWHILMKGAIIQAAEGDLDAAKRSQTMGKLLIDHPRRFEPVEITGTVQRMR
jgi:hypothetical protein